MMLPILKISKVLKFLNMDIVGAMTIYRNNCISEDYFNDNLNNSENDNFLLNVEVF